MKQRIAFITALITGCLFALAGLILLIPVSNVQAQEVVTAPTGDNSFCVVCHSNESSTLHTFASGESISVAIDPTILESSVHGSSNPEGALGCVDCHGTTVFPHDNPPAASAREYRITQSNLCVSCHQDQAENLADDVHYTAVAAGNLRAATCVDCHGGHDIQSPNEPRTTISQTCGECHQIVFNEYAQSVHGVALMEGDPNVPTCTDCHGVHGIEHPTTALFRNRSPQLCATCHADAELMSQYDISTNVFDSYVADFHGSTVTLFEQEYPDTPSNKAVCFDCHGVHDIARADAENSHVIRENLLETCQECHPGATADFPNSWVGHFPPTFETHPFLYLVNLFYDIVIPVTIGGFLFLVATDIIRRIRTKFTGH